MNAFGLDHRVAPAASLTAFIDLAVPLGIAEVEVRNELPGVVLTAIPPFIATLGMTVTARSVAQLYTRGQPISMPADNQRLL